MTGRILRVAVGLFLYVFTYLALRLLPNQNICPDFNTAVQLGVRQIYGGGWVALKKGYNLAAVLADRLGA